jgi:DNA-binding transcriptional LysR family regulator
MIRIDDLDAFVAIVEKGGQTAAARQLRRSLQSISRSLSALEQDLKVQLVRRTTRQSRPTEAGQAFYRRIKPALADIHEARLETANRQAEPSGLLKIGAPEAFASAFIVPTVRDFMERHPGVEVELQASDRPVDFFTQQLDLAVRIRELPDSGMRARKLGDLRIGVIGAPAYFARRGRPMHPNDLAGHDCIVRVLEGEDAAWPFRINGRRRLVRVGGRFRANTPSAIHAAVAAGLGLGLAPLWQVRTLIERGDAAVVLEKFESARIPIHAVWPPTRQPALRVRLFVDYLAAKMRQDRL